jgi:surface antigen
LNGTAGAPIIAPLKLECRAMIRLRLAAATLIAALPGLALAQDASLGTAAVGSESGAYLGSSFSNLSFYNDGQAAMVGGLAGSVLGALALSPVGAAPLNPVTTPEAAKPPIALRVECRSVTNSFTIDGKPQEVKGMACKQPDGSWKMAPEGDLRPFQVTQ